jgi:hypothetical protein
MCDAPRSRLRTEVSGAPRVRITDPFASLLAWMSLRWSIEVPRLQTDVGRQRAMTTHNGPLEVWYPHSDLAICDWVGVTRTSMRAEKCCQGAGLSRFPGGGGERAASRYVHSAFPRSRCRHFDHY